jgi:hypothetical protein
MRADSLAPGSVVDTLGGPAMVLALSFTGERTTVHNISVAGNPNYFVGPDGVWVHNAKCPKKDIREFATKFWGFQGPLKTGPNGQRYSHGEEWFTNGREYFTYDNTNHRGGIWKVYDKQNNRLRTIDLNGETVGK